MELLAALGIAGIIGGLGFALWYERGKRADSDRDADHAKWRANGLADERDIASSKMGAQARTILHLTSLLFESDVDPRVVAAAMSEHDRMLSEADADHPRTNDDLHPLGDPGPGLPGSTEGLPGGGVLGRDDGEGGGEVSDPREDASG